MDIKKIIEEDNEVTAKNEAVNEAVNEMQRNIIKGYEKIGKITDSLTDKLTIDRNYRDEIHKFFIDNGFQKSNKNHKGLAIMTDLSTYYKRENTWLEISFNEYSKTEDRIQINLPLKEIYHGLAYKLNDDATKVIDFLNGFALNGEILFPKNYKAIVLSCDSIDKLSILDKQIKARLDYLQSNIDNGINTDYLYELQNGDQDQFETFAEAFGAL